MFVQAIIASILQQKIRTMWLTANKMRITIANSTRNTTEKVWPHGTVIKKNHSFNINKRVIWQSESKYRALPAHTRTHTYAWTWHSIFLTWQRNLSISICLIIFILSRWTFKFTVPITSKNRKIQLFFA